MGRQASEELQEARMNVVDILTSRYNGDSCRAIAERYNIPEHTVHTIMKETGYAGRFHAKPQRRRQTAQYDRDEGPTLNQLIQAVEAEASEMVIERSADDEGWIVSIDDIPGGQRRSIAEATRSAYLRWAGEMTE